ncbi:MAG: hypothetical protein JNM38_04590 [Acidobacteria bacterium]|jgi:hypothetical protein|nr:hypothetical protein [Acidobacteriota bacterium]
MARPGSAALVCFVAALGAAASLPAAAQETDLSGTWVLNWGASQFPRTVVGFGMDLLPRGATSESLDDSPYGGGSGAPVLAPSRESEADAKNTRQLVDEVRRPPIWLRVTQSSTAVSITDDRGQTRTFSTGGRDEAQRLAAGPVPTTARWEGRQLVVRYRVSPVRELRYTIGRSADPDRLTVEVRFIERGGRDAVTRVYDPLPAGAQLPTAVAAPAPVTPGALPAPADVAASGDRREPLGTQAPDAELAGIRSLGLVVEELTSQAAACGLERTTLESAVAASLGAAGLTVSRNSDDDTYLYIDVMTASVSNGLCVSRFDASLYTHTTASLTHQSRPLLVRVLLLHDGAMAGNPPKEHGANVVADVVRRVEQFAAKIRAAGQ